jgi:hypothetical protein
MGTSGSQEAAVSISTDALFELTRDDTRGESLALGRSCCALVIPDANAIRCLMRPLSGK